MLTLRVSITGRNAADLEEALHDVMRDVELGYVSGRDAAGAVAIEYEVSGVDECEPVEIG